MNQEPKNLLNLVREILPEVKEVLVLAGSLDDFVQSLGCLEPKRN